MKSYTIYLGLTTNKGVDLTDDGEYDKFIELSESAHEILRDCGVDGCTIIPSVGWWNGDRERGLTIYFSADNLANSIDDICLFLGREFQQDAVGYHESPELTIINTDY